MAQVDHDRRTLRLDGEELGLLAAAAGGAGQRLLDRPESAAPRAALERAGVLRDGRPAGWPGTLAGIVARPEARLEVDHGPAPGAGDPETTAHRVWVAGEHAVVGREEPGGSFAFALVRRSLAVVALARALDLRPRPRPAGAEARDLAAADVASLGDAATRAWRITSSLDGADGEPLTLVDAGAGGLWAVEPLGAGRVRAVPATLDEVLPQVAARLGMRASPDWPGSARPAPAG